MHNLHAERRPVRQIPLDGARLVEQRASQPSFSDVQAFYSHIPFGQMLMGNSNHSHAPLADDFAHLD